MFVIFFVSTVSDAPHLSVTKGHVGTQTTDVGLTGIVQLWFQPNILRLRGQERRKGNEGKCTENFILQMLTKLQLQSFMVLH